MKMGRLQRALGAVSAACALVLLAPTPASAAPAAPGSYTMFVRAYPLFWAGSSALPGEGLTVPYVQGVTNSVPLAEAEAMLAESDLTETTVRGDRAEGLACSGFAEGKCHVPFIPEAKVGHYSPDPARSEQLATFDGPDGKLPGRIHALTDCPAECGHQLVRTVGDASGPPGAVSSYISMAGSSASHDTSIDPAGRLVSVARSELRDVVIGPNQEVRFSSLTTTATATGLGTANSKEGHADLRVEDFVILDNPVTLTPAGLRLASGAPSEQEAYDGAQALLQKLKERGITLALPDFTKQVDRQPDFVAVKVKGLTVRFERSVEGPTEVPGQEQPPEASAVTQVLDLGSSTALVAAFDGERDIAVSIDGEEVKAEAPAPAAPVQDPGTPDSTRATVTPPPAPSEVAKPRTQGRSVPPNARIDVKSTLTPPTPTTEGETRDATFGPPVPEAGPGTSTDPNETALPSPGEIVDTLGLRGAQSVSRAFGAFLGLGLILPVARFVIRRFG